MNRLSILAGMLVVWPALAEAQERPVTIPPEEMRAAAAAAQEVLRTYARLVNQGNYEALGFESPREIEAATLGRPLQEFMVRLDELRAYDPSRPALELLHSNQRLRYPVAVEDRTRSSITLTRDGERWVAHSFGDAQLARALAALRAELASREGAGEEEYFEVRVPALNVLFLGRARGGELLLTPVLADARFRFERGATLPGSEALGRMVEAAREHNELPT